MSYLLSALYIFLSLVLFLVLFQTYKTARIYIIYKYKYGNQIKFLFFPVLGLVYFMERSLKKNNEGAYFIRKVCKENPEVKAIIVLSGLFNYFIALDYEWVKYLSQDQERFYKNDGAFAYSSLFGDSLIFTRGKTWKRQRLLLNSSFHYEALKSRVPVFKDEAKNFMNTLIPEKGFVKVDIFDETQKITSEIIARTFFHKELKNECISSGKQLSKEFEDVSEDAYRYRLSSPYFILKSSFLGNTGASYILNSPAEKKLLSRIYECNSMIEKYVDESIQEIKQSGVNIYEFQPKNFSEVYCKEYLIQQQNIDNIPQEDRITKQEIIQQYNTFFFGGTDTTSHLISMTLYGLSQNQSAYKKLQEELDQKVLSFDEFDHTDLSKLTYLDAVVKESTRLYYAGPMTFPRRIDQDYQREDLFISKDLSVSYRLAQFAENFEVFNESEKFIPERFFGNTKMNPYDFMPFSTGARNCIGQHMGILEGKYVLMYILKNFDIKPVPNYNLKMIQFIVNQPLDKELIYIQRKAHSS